MSDETSTSLPQNLSSPAASGGRSAGAILREARQAQGVHIAALAATMKVAQKKLEALEADRIEELPDATFARALAKTVCRTLKIDPEPVLALLPRQQMTGRLEHVSEGINEPFRDHGGRRDDGEWIRLRSPVVWLPLLLLIAVAGVLMAPQGLMLRFLPASGAASGAASNGVARSAPAGTTSTAEPLAMTDATAASSAEPAPASAPSAAVAAAAFAASVADAAASTVSRVAAAASVEAASLAGMGPVQLHARQESWIEVQDARAKVLIGRSLNAGETVFLDGPAPFRVKIGNAAGTELTYRGRTVDLAPSTRDNVARLELK